VYGARSDADPLLDDAAYSDARSDVLAALNDDLNVPHMVGLLNRYGSHRLWLEFDAVLGLDIAERTGRRDEELPPDVASLVELRNSARQARDWNESDRIRDELVAMGYEVGDGPSGTTVRRRPL